MTIKLADGLAEGWYDHDWDELPEIARLSGSRLTTGCTVYDCGAHQGVVALILAGIAGPTGRVIAVEANAHNAAVARENVARNAAGRAPVEVVQAAVAGRDGSLTFDQNLNGQIAGKRRRAGNQTVPAVTLNTLAGRFPQPDVVFLDIEGAEADALTAADELFRDSQCPDWYVEVHARHGLEALGGSVAGVVAFFRDRGYAVEYCTGAQTEFRPLSAAIEPTLTDRFLLIATAGTLGLRPHE